MPYINIHTHKTTTEKDEISIFNQLLHLGETSDSRLKSIGWHPWYIELKDFSMIVQEVNQIKAEKNLAAIGECGIDRAVNISIEKQKNLLNRHIEKAEELEKPIIIHCVKAYSDLLNIAKNRKIETPLILHAYNGNLYETDQLLKYNIYFSFGHQLINNPKLESVFKELPPEKIFFETDESDISIKNIYFHAAKLKQINRSEMQEQILKNFKKVFNNELVEQNRTARWC